MKKGKIGCTRDYNDVSMISPADGRETRCFMLVDKHATEYFGDDATWFMRDDDDREIDHTLSNVCVCVCV